MTDASEISDISAQLKGTGGAELANRQSFINGPCALIGVPRPHGSKADDADNRARAAEEIKVDVRWLHPESQAPDYQASVTQTFDLGEGPAPMGDNVNPWPGTLPEQVSAVQSFLATTGPLDPQDVARAFKGIRASTVRPVLDALTGLGMARWSSDGRYAA